MANHNTSVQPWGGEIPIAYHKVLGDREYAKFLKKHCWLVRVEIGEGEVSEWGEWGIPGSPMPQSRYAEIVGTHPQDSSYLLIQESFYDMGSVAQSTADPIYVWSRYLRPFIVRLIPANSTWTHLFEQEVLPYPGDDHHQHIHGRWDQDSVTYPINRTRNAMGSLLVPIELQWHRILIATDLACCFYKWAECVTIKVGSIDDAGDWGVVASHFVARDLGGGTYFRVLRQKPKYLLLQACEYNQADGSLVNREDFTPIWVWSKFCRSAVIRDFPREHPWVSAIPGIEPSLPQEPAGGYQLYEAPPNVEE